jgi:hypothetical protein
VLNEVKVWNSFREPPGVIFYDGFSFLFYHFYFASMDAPADETAGSQGRSNGRGTTTREHVQRVQAILRARVRYCFF